MSKIMHLTVCLALACGLVSFSATQAGAESEAVAVGSARQTETGPLKRTEVSVAEIEAVVKELDLKTRKITVESPKGKLVTLNVSPKVKRLSEFKVGDKIVVQHYEALAYEVRPPTPEELKNPAVSIAGAAKAPTDLPPGVEAGMISHVIVTIENIDLKENTVTVKFPDGADATFRARVPENLKRVKVGDTVAVTLAEGVAVSLSKS